MGETTHGRVAMLSIIGFLVQESGFHPLFDTANKDIGAGIRHLDEVRASSPVFSKFLPSPSVPQRPAVPLRDGSSPVMPEASPESSTTSITPVTSVSIRLDSSQPPLKNSPKCPRRNSSTDASPCWHPWDSSRKNSSTKRPFWKTFSEATE